MEPPEPQFRCPACDQVHGFVGLRPAERAVCVRCGATMAERGRFGPQAGAVFALTGLLLFVPALVLPFVVLRKFGHERTTLLTVGFEGFARGGFTWLGLWVLVCGALAPLALLVLLLASRRGNERWRDRLGHWAAGIEYWAMPEVQVLGVLVAFFKLGTVVDIAVGPGLWCYAAAAIFLLLAWRRLELRPAPDRAPAAPERAGPAQSAALAAAALVMLVPAYALPVMHLGIVGEANNDTTILSGILQLWRQDLPGLALIVFTASFLVPLLKLAGLAWLLAAVWWPRWRRARSLTRVFGWIDFIGRWSMLDVFLVAFLSGAVRFGRLASVQPRPGILAFGAVVILTMLATHRFDPRVLWPDKTP
jgi:paraquat-inducible protein A